MCAILQFDVYGSAHGLLASHPVTPFISMHHLEVIEPPFPGLSALEGLKHLVKAMRTDPGSFLQQSICYDHKLGLSISISLGYVVQVFPEIILPRILTTVETSFTAWNHDNSALEFSFDTRPVSMLVCKQPFLFYMEGMHVDENNSRKTVSTYGRYSNVDKAKTDAHCWFYHLPPEKLQKIMVISESLTTNWYMVSPQKPLFFPVIFFLKSYIKLSAGQILHKFHLHGNDLMSMVVIWNNPSSSVTRARKWVAQVYIWNYKDTICVHLLVLAICSFLSCSDQTIIVFKSQRWRRVNVEIFEYS